MATNRRLATRRRIPKLSETTEGPKGRYYASYRDADGKCHRRRFTRDRKESEQEYRRWVIENYDDAADIVIRDGSGFKGDPVQALPHIANVFIKHDEGRVRPDGSARKKGTITLRAFDDNRRQVVSILDWAKERFGNRLKHESLADLFTETDCEAMMMSFAKRRPFVMSSRAPTAKSPDQAHEIYGDDRYRRLQGTSRIAHFRRKTATRLLHSREHGETPADSQHLFARINERILFGAPCAHGSSACCGTSGISGGVSVRVP